MTGPTDSEDGSPAPADRRPTPGGGDRRPALRRAPGERYAGPETATDAGTETGAAVRRPSTARAVGLGALVGLAGVVTLVVLGGVFAMTAGLIAVAGVIGWGVGTTVSANASPSTSRTVRGLIAAILAVDAVVLGQIGLWLYAAAQGGTLELVDYLAEAWGPLVLVELVVAWLIAGWTAR
jgi:hypothetical protein